MSISPPSLPHTLPSFSFNFHSLSITPLQMSMCYVWHYLLSSKQGYTKKGRCTNIFSKIDRYTCCPKAIYRISLLMRYDLVAHLRWNTINWTGFRAYSLDSFLLSLEWYPCLFLYHLEHILKRNQNTYNKCNEYCVGLSL